MKKPKVPNIVAVMVLTVITISSWIVFGVVRIFRAEPTPSIPPEILNPLDPNYDKTVVDKIQERIFFDKEQIFTSPTTSPEAATGSGELNI